MFVIFVNTPNTVDKAFKCYLLGIEKNKLIDSMTYIQIHFVLMK